MIDNPNEPEILRIIRNLHKNRNATSLMPRNATSAIPTAGDLDIMPEDFDFDTDYSGQSVEPMFSGNKYVDAIRDVQPKDLVGSLLKSLAPIGTAAGKAALPPGISPMVDLAARDDINALNRDQALKSLLKTIASMRGLKSATKASSTAREGLIEALMDAANMNNQISNEEIKILP
jgi:hypothetical protein